MLEHRNMKTSNETASPTVRIFGGSILWLENSERGNYIQKKSNKDHFWNH